MMSATASAPNEPDGSRRRMLALAVTIALAFGGIAAQLIRLGTIAGDTAQASMLAPLSQSWARPDIIDRKGRLLATDVYMQSLYADPSAILDLDEVVEKLAPLLPGMSPDALRSKLANRQRRFAWIRRGISPALAQRVHDLGLPGLFFRRELQRIYPAGPVAGHILGRVDVDNRGLAGIERHIDDHIGVVPEHGADKALMAPVVLSLDLGVQHALLRELRDAVRRYQAKGASGLVLDVKTGEILAAVSLPLIDPAKPEQATDPARRDKLAASTYELGSIFKALTLALAIDSGGAGLDTTYDVTQPIELGKKLLRETHAPRRPINAREVFIYSSNVGAALMGLDAGAPEQRAFLKRLGLLTPIRTEAGPVAKPILPKIWNDVATATIAFGHGIAVSPLQFAAAAGALVNGGVKIRPSFFPTLLQDEGTADNHRVITRATSDALREVMRLNVTSPHGTGKRAAAPGYRVGGKTGTAEIASKAGYKKKSVISSFLAAFPMDAPRYLTLVSIYEPKGNNETRGSITASANAAPTTSHLVTRIAPMLGVYPRGTE